ncbi:MAG: PQQ-binding-like beta-propeller repeat protein [Pirellulales bacterium]
MADAPTLRSTKEIKRPQIFFCVARQPDGQKVFCGASDGKIYAFDLAEEKPEPAELVGHTSYVTGVTTAGDVLVSCSYDGRLIWWDVATGSILRTVDAHPKWIRRVEASPDGATVASVADDMICRVWDVRDGRLLHELRGHDPQTPNHYPSMLFACAYSPDGRLLATADKVGRTLVWDLASGQQCAALDAPQMYTWDPKQRRHSIGGIRSLAFSPDGRLLAVGGIGQIGNIDHLGGLARVEVFDWRAGERTNELVAEKQNGLVERLIFHPQGDWLLAAGGDNGGFIHLLDLKQNKTISEAQAPAHLHDAILGDTPEVLFTSGHEHVMQWQLET